MLLIFCEKQPSKLGSTKKASSRRKPGPNCQINGELSPGLRRDDALFFMPVGRAVSKEQIE